jgi:cobalt-zinc-cadmium efflux system outer membrane protein
MEASFQAEGAEASLRVAVIEALARVTRDDERLRRAREEASGLEALADALATQAERGRASEGEAARAHLAMVSAHTIAAEVAAAAATSREDLALLLGLEPGTPLRLTLSVCEARPPGESLDTRPAEVLVASARQQIAAAGVVQRRATRIPDLLPQIGVRRAAGVSALYVGFSLPLPLFDRSGASVDAAIAEEDAQAAELERVERSVAAQREAARQGVLALEAAGTRYTPTWAAALDRSVVATESRYRLGEGTLTELLDGRRARLQALDDYERWRAELFSGRARFALLAGGSIDPSLLCGASLPSMTHTPENRP